MPDNLSSNKRIAKNTMLLYAWMLLLLVVSLYTSRVVLATLGIDDYGLYNVVGGIVTMFTFISMAMGNSTSRYITFAIGKGDENELKSIVGVAFMIHWVLAGIILVLAETIGLWFLYNKMVIPEGRMTAAFWVYQFSVVSCMVSIVSVPFNSMIIAHEKMGAFAFISILDAVLKLLIVYLIQITSHDRLILYAALILVIFIIDRFIYQFYCHRHFPEAKRIRFQKSEKLGEMTSFAVWSMCGNLASVGYTQGLNILLNMFFGPAVNAARGVAVQVQSVLNGFVTNFQTAVNPQITKSYASGDNKRVLDLLTLSSKFSFFLMLMLCLPVFIEAPKLLSLWLVEVPDHTINFIRLLILIMLAQTLHNPVSMIKSATGRIRTYQLTIGGILLAIVPISYVALKMGAPAEVVFCVHLFIQLTAQTAAVLMVRKDIGLSFHYYLKHIIINVCLVALLSSLMPIITYLLLPDTIASMILVIIVSILSAGVSVFFLGLQKNERNFLINRVFGIIKKEKKND